MMHEKSTYAEHEKHHFGRCFSWSAIVIGALVGVGLGFLLNLFSATIGLTIFSTTPDGAATIAIGGLIGTLIGTVAIMYTMGWVSGYLARPYCAKPQMGALYGFGSWTVALIISILLMGQLGEFIASNYYSIAHPQGFSKMAGQNEMPGMMQMAQNGQSKNPRAEANPKHTTPAAPGAGKPLDEKTMKTLQEAILYTFILFFIAAISSCFGGYFGASARCKEEGYTHRKD